MEKKILVTSALPYANGPLHFGHIAGAYLPADCYARFQRLCSNNVLYICGSDEYGIAITLSADLAKRTPKEHVDIFHHINQIFLKNYTFPLIIIPARLGKVMLSLHINFLMICLPMVILKLDNRSTLF